MKDSRTTAQIDDELRAALPDHMQDDFDDLCRERDEAKAEAEGLQSQVDTLENDVTSLQNTVDDLEAGEDVEADLPTVRYWLHDGLFLKKPIEPPQRILRMVERALGVE